MPRDARILALANQKGGVAKTTTTLNLGVALKDMGARVLAIDLDPQSNLSMSQGIDVEGLGHGMYHVLTGATPIADIIEVREIDIAPAGIELAGAELALSAAIGRERSLERALRPVRDLYDYILLDTPPSLGLLTINAMVAAEGVIVPVQCEYLSLRGLAQLRGTLQQVRENLNPAVDIVGILPTMYDGRTVHSREAVQMLEESFGDRVYRTRIGKTIRFAEAPVEGTSVIRYEPQGQAARWYRQLAREVAASPVGVALPGGAAGGRGMSTRGQRPSMREGPLSELFRSTDPSTPPPLGPPEQEPDHGPYGDASNYVAVIRVVGVGGAGCNAVDRMIEAGLRGVEFVAVNTDRQALEASDADVRIPVGMELTRGLGTGGDPHLGEQAIKESEDHVRRALRGSDLVFIAAGEGGGTGTGAAPIIAKIARELGALTVAVVTRPFAFEGNKRTTAALEGLERLPGGRGHGHRDPQRPPDVGARARHEHGRGLQGRRRPPAPGRAGHLRHDHAARPDQPRLRRRPHHHPRSGHRAARHRLRRRWQPGHRGRAWRRSPRRCWRPRSTAPRASCSASPAARTCRSSRSARRRASWPTRPTPTPTSSSARPSTRTSRARCG